MKAYLYGLMINLQFFSIIPVRKEVPMTDKYFDRAIRLFPVLGIIFGVIYAASGWLLLAYTPVSVLLTTLIIWLLTIILCGGIHIDAWMDTSDAFFSYQDPKRRLEIMSDPRIGAFGVIGAIVLLATKFVFIYEVLANYTSLTFILIFLIPVLSRALMGFVLGFLPNAKATGMGHLFQKAKTKYTYVFYLFYVALSFILIVYSIRLFIIFWILVLVTAIFFWLVKLKVIKWFGGITGDVVGAATEGVEVILWGVVLLLTYFGMG